MKWLRAEDEFGLQHVLRLDERPLHFRTSPRATSCVCNPRIVQGVIVHRTITRKLPLYAPWYKRADA